MAVIGIVAAHGSPGATTLAVALAHRLGVHRAEPPLLIEADPDGGVIAARHGLLGAAGLTALAGAARAGLQAGDLERFAVPMASGLPVIAAHPSPEQTHAAVRVVAGPLAAAIGGEPGPGIVIDLGRLRPGSPAEPLAAVCDELLVVVRPELDQVLAIADRLDTLGRFAALRVVVVGDRPYPPSEVRSALGVPAVAVIAADARAVTADPAAARRRGRWQRSVDVLAGELVADGAAEATTSTDEEGDELMAVAG